MFKLILIGAIISVGIGFTLARESAPTLTNLVEWSSVVTGKAEPGSAPITIYDISFPVKTKIGMANTTTDDGSFSSPVRPPLVKGHQIVAIDNDGNASAPVTVVAEN